VILSTSNNTKILYTEVRSIRNASDKDEELLFMIPGEFMKGYGLLIRETGVAMSYSVMAIRIKANIKMVRHMEKELIYGEMEKYMMVNGLKDRNKGMEYGKESTEIAILVSGMRVRLKGMESIHGLMEIGMKANGSSVCVMETEQTFSLMEICMLVSIRLESQKVLVSTSGLMVIHTQDSLNLVRKTAKESGRNSLQISQIKTISTNTTVITN
jgi:hypothetical protein